jgi:hypothetical protein
MVWLWGAEVAPGFDIQLAPGIAMDKSIQAIEKHKLGTIQEKAMVGNAEDFKNNGIPVFNWNLPERNVYNIAYLIATLQLMVAVFGDLRGLGLRTYLQEYVDGYKRETKKALGAVAVSEFGKAGVAVGPTESVETFLQDAEVSLRSEVREIVLADLNVTMGQIALVRNPTLEAALITAEKVTAGILSRLDAVKVFVSGVVIEIAQKLFPGHFSAVPTGTMAVEAREKASALLGIRSPTASDVFVLGHGFFSQDHRVAAGLREVYPATTIVAIVNTAGERAFLEELNLRLAKEGLLPILATGPESPAELKAHLAKVQGTIRATALLYSAESIPSALKQQLPNTVIVTSRMLKGFLNAIDMLVNGLVKDLKAQFAMARSA